MKVLILDDDKVFSEQLKNDLFYYFCEYYDKTVFTLIQNAGIEINETFDFDYAFIDIDLPQKNGILFAYELKEKHPNTILIFISSHINLIHNTLVVNPFYFIRKTDYQKDLTIFFDLIKDKVRKKEIIDLCYNFEKTRIFTDEIIYIEAQLHKLIFHTKSKEIFDNHSLKEMQLLLPKENFIRIHKSFIINADFLSKVTTNSVELSNSINLNIGRRYKESFINFYQDYLIK